MTLTRFQSDTEDAVKQSCSRPLQGPVEGAGDAEDGAGLRRYAHAPMPIGAHVKASGGLSNAVGRAQEIGAECLQVFLCAPQQWRAPGHTDEEVSRFCELATAAGLGPNFVHAIYLINMASADGAIRARSIEAMATCASWADRCGLEGLIVHIGSGKGQPVEDAERQLVSALGEVLERSDNARILLENSAGAGHTLGARFQQIGGIMRALDNHPRLGVCLDTAHAFGSGYDLRGEEGLTSMLEEIDQHVGLERLRAVHANDSKADLASARDLHENIGHGKIGEEAFARMLTHPSLRGLPWLLEVPGFDREGPDRPNVDALKRLAGRGVT